MDAMNDNEYKTCPDCCYDILDDEGDVMDHECISDNEMIAEFMGADPDKKTFFRTGEYVYFYDTSWDWLIPVVNKIEMECEGVPLQLIDVSFYDEIHEVYWAVIEFIKIHNKSNKMDTLPTSVQRG